MEPSTKEIIRRIHAYCAQAGIATSKVLAITIQRNRTTEFSSLIVDFEAELLLPIYPVEKLSDYKEKACGEFLVCYRDDLTLLNLNVPPLLEDSSKGPYCCDGIYPYKGIRTASDELFEALLRGSGHHPNVVFEVKRQVNRGPLISTRYFKLEQSGVTETQGGSLLNKKHVFKNYKCDRHNLFFLVDLYMTENSGTGYNYHHMRLNPCTKVNEALLFAFFSEVKV